MEDEGLPKNPDLALAQYRYLLGGPAKADKKESLEITRLLLDAIKKDNMAPFYEEVAAELKWEIDRPLLEEMRRANKEAIAKLDATVEDAQQNQGETEVREANLAKSEYLCRIGDKEGAVNSFQKTFEKTISLGQHSTLSSILFASVCSTWTCRSSHATSKRPRLLSRKVATGTGAIACVCTRASTSSPSAISRRRRRSFWTASRHSRRTNSWTTSRLSPTRSSPPCSPSLASSSERRSSSLPRFWRHCTTCRTWESTSAPFTTAITASFSRRSRRWRRCCIAIASCRRTRGTTCGRCAFSRTPRYSSLIGASRLTRWRRPLASRPSLSTKSFPASLRRVGSTARSTRCGALSRQTVRTARTRSTSL
eukprot:Opistho-1_new@22191